MYVRFGGMPGNLALPCSLFLFPHFLSSSREVGELLEEADKGG